MKNRLLSLVSEEDMLVFECDVCTTSKQQGGGVLTAIIKYNFLFLGEMQHCISPYAIVVCVCVCLCVCRVCGRQENGSR